MAALETGACWPDTGTLYFPLRLNFGVVVYTRDNLPLFNFYAHRARQTYQYVKRYNLIALVSVDEDQQLKTRLPNFKVQRILTRRW